MFIGTGFGLNRVSAAGDAYGILNSRFRPALVFDFDNEYYRVDGGDTTFANAITHTRASTATFVDADGILQTAAINQPRIGHHVWNGSAWVNEGLLHESEARTNLLLNSGTLATQSVTVSAVAHTIHFTGTGTITLSGASTTGPLVGTGAGEGNRVSLTFTPIAAPLIITVTGTVTNAQLEVGPTPSSYIPTAGSAATRAADVLTVPAANLPYSSTAISIQMDGRVTYADLGTFGTATPWRWRLDDNNRIQINVDTDGALTGRFTIAQVESGVASFATGPAQLTAGVLVPYDIASRHGSTFVQLGLNGANGTVNTAPVALPNLSSANFALGHAYNGTIRTFRMWGQDITDAGLVEATS
jgi:hypothetical protein